MGEQASETVWVDGVRRFGYISLHVIVPCASNRRDAVHLGGGVCEGDGGLQSDQEGPAGQQWHGGDKGCVPLPEAEASCCQVAVEEHPISIRPIQKGGQV